MIRLKFGHYAWISPKVEYREFVNLCTLNNFKIAIDHADLANYLSFKHNNY